VRLRSVELELPDVGRAADFLSGVWGLIAAGKSKETHFFRGTGTHPYILSITSASSPAVVAITFSGSAQEIQKTDRTFDVPGGGKGFEIRIYDPIVNPDRLVGANRRYVEARLPHLQRLLHSTPQDALRGSDVAVVSTSDAATVAALRAAPPARIFDISGRLGSHVECLSGYEGIGWAV